MYKQKWLILSILVVSLLCLSPLQAVEMRQSSNQILPSTNPDIKDLEWNGPPGSLPGTFSEYEKSHPYGPAVFSHPLMDTIHANEGVPFTILVEHGVYGSVNQSIEKYAKDLIDAGYAPEVETLEGGSPESVKQWLRERYADGCEGFVFIGDIPAAWAEVSGSVFPSELFYYDLDGEWKDVDDDGVYEDHTSGEGDMGPEVYIGRIYTSSLSWDDEASLIDGYLKKTHEYRSGELSQPWKGLEYVEEDWYDMDVALDNIYGNDVERFDFGFDTTADDYLEQMSVGQHFTQVCVHSWTQGHAFSTHPTEGVSYAHVYVFSPIERDALLLLGADDGIRAWFNGMLVFENDRYYSQWDEDQFSVPILLSAGWNRLLVKVSQKDGEYGFSARLTDPSKEGFDDLLYQLDDPEECDMAAPYVRSWLLHGFHQDISDEFYEYLTTEYLSVDEGSISPEEGEWMEGIEWTLCKSSSPLVNLEEYYGEVEYGICYAYVEVSSEERAECELWMGYDDGARVWLNGKEIIYDNRYGTYEQDSMKVPVTLDAGVNRLVVKISQWMGDYRFSARFCTDEGKVVEGLTYSPQWAPVSHIGTWLINGVYANENQHTRLSEAYLGDEGSICPCTGETATRGVWQQGIVDARPVDLASFFEDTKYVTSETIHEVDPPVLFYNLFSCGPGRFTDEDYLSGTYIFGTTYGLSTIASAKSGSMLGFDDFTRPLGEGASIGEAFRSWFDAQAPFALWEQEWFYGMVVNGDPTLTLISTPTIEFIRPSDGIYLEGEKKCSFFLPLIIGEIEVEVSTRSQSTIEQVEFFIDDESVAVCTQPPYVFSWAYPDFFKKVIRCVSLDSSGVSSEESLTVWKFF